MPQESGQMLVRQFEGQLNKDIAPATDSPWSLLGYRALTLVQLNDGDGPVSLLGHSCPIAALHGRTADQNQLRAGLSLATNVLNLPSRRGEVDIRN
jgi:hypothetical protein